MKFFTNSGLKQLTKNRMVFTIGYYEVLKKKFCNSDLDRNLDGVRRKNKQLVTQMPGRINEVSNLIVS